MNKEEAKRILGDFGDVFWCKDGKVFKNLYELRDGLEMMSDETFNHHFNEGKNDFRNWIIDVIKDKTLANKISKVKSRKDVLKSVKNRIKQLERI